MVIKLKSTASLSSTEVPKPGRHRYNEGFTLPGFGRRIGATPAMWEVGNLLGRHGRKVEPVTRRAAR
jgi:hypothetical protein